MYSIAKQKHLHDSVNFVMSGHIFTIDTIIFHKECKLTRPGMWRNLGKVSRTSTALS